MYRSLLFACALAAAPIALAQTSAPVVTSVAAAPAAASLVGRWTYRVEVPDRTIAGVLTFEPSGNGLSGHIGLGSSEQTMPLSDLALAADGSATFWIAAPGDVGRVDFAVRTDGARLSGQMSAMGYAFPLAGERADVPAAPLVVAVSSVSFAGTWNYALETPNGASSGRIELVEDASGALSGRMVRATGEASAFTSVTRDGNTLTLVYPSERYGSMTMRLVRTGDALDGALLVGQSEMPVRATRAAH